MSEASLPDRTFDAIVFDWDGTAVADRRADASAVRRRVEALCAAGVHVAVVSGTHVQNVDGQLAARPDGPGRLFLCLNRGSEVYEVGVKGPTLRWRRVAGPDESRSLDETARRMREQFARQGLVVEIVSDRLNRRKLDLIPEPAWSDPPKARIAHLLEAVEARLAGRGFSGLAEVVADAVDLARASGLDDVRVTTDAKHVEVGLTDKSDSARWVFENLWGRGIGPGLVLIAGDEFGTLGGVNGSDAHLLVPEATRSTAVSVGVEPEGVPFGVRHLDGGPERFVALLDDQLERRRRGRTPGVDEDPRWTIEFRDGLPEQLRVRETLATVADGAVGTRGALEERGTGTTSMVLAAGVYHDGEHGVPTLLPGPEWTGLDASTVGEGRRVLDLRTGVLWREAPAPSGFLTTLRFASLARPGVAALRAEAPVDDLMADDPLASPWGGDTRFATTQVSAGRGGGIVAAVAQVTRRSASLRTFERLVGFDAAPARRPSLSRARSLARGAREAGFDRLLAEQRVAWAEQWNDAHVVIEGDEETERAVRFALFHLVSSARPVGEAALGARGLSGPAYGGHVFWDADVFALPTLAAIAPRRARAMLEYRIRRLPAAQRLARERGFRGARFPWESADDGTEATPAWVHDGSGTRTRIVTGSHADHISSDVAWAALRYGQWTGDGDFLRGPGRALVVEAARFWASRIRVGDDGRAHVYGVVGPDEYHEIVDDNAYTNIMARWTLRSAAALHPGEGSREGIEWRSLADALVDGYDPTTGLYEQFAGFYGLEPIFITEMVDVPVAADLLLGRDAVARAQVVKQPDVLMLHFLVPDEVAPGSLEPNLDFYGPRTAHGSSLSPAVHAGLLARAGRRDEALTAFRLAARLDLDDLTGTTAGGLHIATMGGLWQALVYGFLGIGEERGRLTADPHLPDAWRRVEVTFRFRGRRVRVQARDGFAAVDVLSQDDAAQLRPAFGGLISGGAS